MLNINELLENFGLNKNNRTIAARFSNLEVNQQLFVNHISINHEINLGLNAELVCLSTSRYITLKKLIGTQVAIDIIADKKQFFRTSGIVTSAEWLCCTNLA